MMKKTLLFLILVGSYLPGGAQQTDSTGHSGKKRNMSLEISGGYSLPLGHYASRDSTSKKSGYALGGWLIQVTFDWMGKHDLGLAIQYTFQQNLLKNAIPDFPSRDSGVIYHAITNHSIMAGPVYSKRIKRIQLNFKLLGGLLLTSGGKLFNTPYQIDSSHTGSHSNVIYGFSCQVSGGVGLVITKHLSALFEIKLLGGWPGIKRTENMTYYIEEKDPLGNPYEKPVYSRVDYSIKKTVTTLNPSIGLIYSF